MIYSFGGRNFFSFRGDFKVDFRVPPQAQERAIFHSDRHGQRVNSVMGIFGANASGKNPLVKVPWISSVVHPAISESSSTGQVFETLGL